MQSTVTLVMTPSWHLPHLLFRSLLKTYSNCRVSFIIALLSISLRQDNQTKEKIDGGKISNGLYHLDVPTLASVAVSTTCWHQQLGHPPPSMMRLMLPDFSLDQFTCESCILERLHLMLKKRCFLLQSDPVHTGVIARIVRGLANFAKCESRAPEIFVSHAFILSIPWIFLSWQIIDEYVVLLQTNGHEKGMSLIENGDSAAFSTSMRQRIDLPLCHLTQKNG